jgi:LCP family protein required for cell wall assembly
MKTTLKRGLGRARSWDGKSESPVYPPAIASAVNRYRQPDPSVRSGLGILRRVLVGTVLVVCWIVLGVAGGLYLYFHESVASVRAHTLAVVRAAKTLDVPLPNHAAIALVIGYDHRAGVESAGPSRSDTLMLIRADPVTKSISLLSFPRDLIVPIYCGASPSDTVGHVAATDRINAAYAICGPKGTVLTLKHLTGLPINYLITVNFHGFKEVVNKLGGVWMDVDRRYYNKNTGSSADNYANINLEPGYQRLSGQEALDFVRFRHTDSDLYRLARQQEFVRAMKEQIAHNFAFTSLPSLVSTITHNIEVGEGGGGLRGDQVISYALFAQGLPAGHLFQDKIANVVCANTCQASASDIQQALDQFTNPDIRSSSTANAAALGEKVKQRTPPPSSVSVTVLNGSQVAGAAANAAYLLGQLGYKTQTPPNNLAPNAPTQNYFHSVVFFDPAQKGSLLAAKALQNQMQPADVALLPKNRALRTLDPGSMLLIVLGSAFSGQISTAPTAPAQVHRAPAVRADRQSGTNLVQPLAKKVKFPLMVPTILERSSTPDTLPGDEASRVYWIDGEGHHKAVRLVFRTANNEFWGIEETDWAGAPAFADKSFRRTLSGRRYDLYYTGATLHMVVLHTNKATYWVVNTLLNSLSNETMLAIARGLKLL